MSDSPHVFVSYVREDAAAVDQLCRVLEAAQIPYWRDRTNLGPGDEWKRKIREAIQSNALVFLPCFSAQMGAKSSSYMNEEIHLAIEELRKMPPGKNWIIPVRFDDSELPDWEISAARRLSDYNCVDLFGDDYAVAAGALVSAVNRLMGDITVDAATVRAAVAQVVDADRAALLVRVTKEMLTDPNKRIQLDDTIGQETRTLINAFADTDRFPITMIPGSDQDRVRSLTEQAEAIWHLSEPFVASLQVATRWADSPHQLAPWTSGLRNFADEAQRVREGMVTQLSLRYLPSLLCTMVVGLTGVATGRWDNVKALLIDNMVTSRDRRGDLQAIVDVADPWRPFDGRAVLPEILARTNSGTDFETAYSTATNPRGGQLYSPSPEWMHAVLRPQFSDLLPADDTYSDHFDRAEIMLGLISQDLALTEALATTGGVPPAPGRVRTRWYGRSTWRVNHGHNPFQTLIRQFQTQQAGWPPIAAGLFGGSVDRAQAAIDTYRETFDVISRERW